MMTKKQNELEPSKTEQFKALTWNELTNWAGTTIVSRGKTYQQGKHVSQLAKTPDGKLVAWVEGTQVYATQVGIDANGSLDSTCSCPYWDTCKHAVAVVLEYLEHVKKSKNVPTTSNDDQRLLQSRSNWEDDDNDFDDDDDDDLEDSEDNMTTSSIFHEYLENLTKEQLINLLEELAGNYSQVRKTLQDRHNLASGNVGNIVDLIKKDISELEDVDDYDDDWDDYSGYNNDDNIDLSQMQQRLEDLLAQGYADKVIGLGTEILSAGKHRVEMEQEGESIDDIADCMTVIFKAVSQSSLSVVEQMLWVIDMESESDYDLCSGSHVFWKQGFSKNNWSDVADILMKGLRPLTLNNGKENFPYRYQYDGTINLIIQALEKSERKSEIIPLCESQVEQSSQGYTRLIEHLRKEGRTEEAIEWIHKGIATTHKEHQNIADKLRDIFLELQKEAKNWPQVAALEADNFFNRPSLHTFLTLEKAAKQAKVLPAIRAAALQYLETGQSPFTAKSPKIAKATKNVIWPLPKPEVPLPKKHFPTQFPERNTLIEIAITEKQPDEVMRWYQPPNTKLSRFGGGSHFDHQVADAVADTYPDTAVEIWKSSAESLIANTTVKAYQQAAPYLQKMQTLLQKQDRKTEWEAYLKDLRITHARKWRLLEVLDGLNGKRIID
ncbi:conserved hypothetical protein [Beggiatoa sp. PS]|nr:conserved hypothetical protein [Beggiatoa sp. PS]